MQTKHFLFTFGLLALVSCGKQTGNRGSLNDHNGPAILQYRLEALVASDANNQMYVVEAGTNYQGYVRSAEVEPKLQSVRVAVPARGAGALSQETEIDILQNPTEAKVSFRAALQNHGTIVKGQSAWLHERVRSGIAPDAPANQEYRLVSFKSLPITLYSSTGAAVARPEKAPVRGKL